MGEEGLGLSRYGAGQGEPWKTEDGRPATEEGKGVQESLCLRVGLSLSIGPTCGMSPASGT